MFVNITLSFLMFSELLTLSRRNLSGGYWGRAFRPYWGRSLRSLTGVRFQFLVFRFPFSVYNAANLSSASTTISLTNGL